ncbi:MAG: hypothetical protein R3B71_04305 [Candidatus Gracilibacteria bacterium]|nr:hypothetical protein [Candidatus Peregrinibacteria bacterium]
MSPSKKEKTKISKPTGPKVGIWLDSYDDIFSNFDPRIYTLRTVSEDFLEQAKNITSDRTATAYDIKLLIPENKRNLTTEKIITEHLKTYFKNQTEAVKSQKKKVLTRGIITSLIGITLMFVATVLAYLDTRTYPETVMLVFFEPTGWFSAWYGLDMIFYTAQEHNKELEFYKKMSDSKITFDKYA